MSTPASVLPVAGTPAAASAQPLTAIQIIKQELGNFFRQKEQAIANVHAIDGAIQSTQHLLAKLEAEEAKAAAFVKAGTLKVETEAKTLIEEAKTEVSKGIALVETEAKKL